MGEDAANGQRGSRRAGACLTGLSRVRGTRRPRV